MPSTAGELRERCRAIGLRLSTAKPFAVTRFDGTVETHWKSSGTLGDGTFFLAHGRTPVEAWGRVLRYAEHVLTRFVRAERREVPPAAGGAL